MKMSPNLKINIIYHTLDVIHIKTIKFSHSESYDNNTKEIVLCPVYLYIYICVCILSTCYISALFEIQEDPFDTSINMLHEILITDIPSLIYFII